MCHVDPSHNLQHELNIALSPKTRSAFIRLAAPIRAISSGLANNSAKSAEIAPSSHEPTYGEFAVANMIARRPHPSIQSAGPSPLPRWHLLPIRS